MIIERAIAKDAEEILKLQKLAYISEAEIYKDFSIEPLRQTLEELQAQFENHIILKATVSDIIVGSVRGRLDHETCYIGKLIVHPLYQNNGIGKMLISKIESECDRALRYELFTGSKSNKNLSIYEKIGYKIFKNEIINEDLSLVYMEKAR